MPRQGRIHIPGGIYHVIIRGIEHRNIYRDKKDRLKFLERFGEGLGKSQIRCYAWALMANHAHFLLSPTKVPLGEFMQGLLTGYAGEFNRKYKRVGHVFHNRYKSILCQEDKYLLKLVRYIHLNPLRAGVVKTLEELADYSWCGHGILMGKTERKWQQTKNVLQYFGLMKRRAIKEYHDYLKAAKKEGEREELEGGGLRRSRKDWEATAKRVNQEPYWSYDERILGEGEFIDQILKNATEDLNQKDVVAKLGWTWEKLINNICSYYKVETEVLRKKWRVQKAGEAKAISAYLGKKYLRYSGVEISGYLQVIKSSASALIQKGERLASAIEDKRLFGLRPPGALSCKRVAKDL